MSNINIYLLHIIEFSYILTKFQIKMKKGFKGKDYFATNIQFHCLYYFI